MCGIAGWVQRAAPGDPATLTAMTRALQHRGPDAEGFYFNSRSEGPQVGLGFRRLSIIDLGGGHQPMTNEDESLWIVFNGEIYNFQELREELQVRGHQFRTRSDTETILHLYEELGEGCLARLRGMFALAIWDASRQSLFLARDRVGKKPLLYAPLPDGGLAFASEFQGILPHPGVRREVNLEALDGYLTFGYIPPPATGFRGVFKLPPAHWLRWREGEVTVQRYWQLDYLPKLELSEVEAGEQLLHTLREAVRLRMIAEVPLGAFLSGGLDSSLVVALMSEFSARPVKTFSIGFAEADFNELDYARAVAERYATDHHELVVEPNALEVVSKLARHYGEPYADSSAVPSYCVAQATRAHVTVALNGDGGDESFAGYERYLGVTLAERYQRLPPTLRRGVIEPAARALLPDSPNRRSRLRQARRFLQVANLPLTERYLTWVTTLQPAWKAAIYTADFAALRTEPVWFRELLNGGDALSSLDRVLRTDVHSYLPFDLLVKMDIATMANSLEARSPFLDHQVMEFAARLPAAFKLRGRSLKYLLKRAAAPLLPPQNIERRKQGFGVPVGEWFRGPLRELLIDTVCSQRALDRGYFKPEGLRRLVSQHLERREDATYPLWALLMLELWHRELVA